ncbi:MAG TPA: high-affinity branched-chain amino acid ABC transporter permease LivM [Alphaproteobacteria bacterium]|nr:high-affinity branched-chain amino acid ABC transporter permease LivM [Alphaproteobacteria bacterium]
MGGVTAVQVLREGALAALVAAGLAVPMLGLKLEHGVGGLSVHGRWELMLLAAAIVGLGRGVMVCTSTSGVFEGLRRGRGVKAAAPGQTLWRRYWGYAALAALIAAIALPFMPFADRYVVDTATQVLIYVLLGWGLNIVVGLAGLLDLGYVAFYAVGAYSFALLGTEFGFGFWICLPLAGVFAASFGILLGYPVLRLRGDYLAIVTLGFGEIVRVVLVNWVDFSGGPNGVTGVPRPTLFGLEFTKRVKDGTAFHDYFGIDYSGQYRIIFLYFIILGIALLTNFFVLRIRKLPLGRAWEALREDEIACHALGINPVNTKLSAFALGAMFGGFAGSFFATRSGFISPESFTFIESAIILAIVVLGGMGSQIGVVLAAAAIILLPEFLREFSEFRMLAFGSAMVLIMIWKPRGLLSRRQPTIRLAGREAPP